MQGANTPLTEEEAKRQIAEASQAHIGMQKALEKLRKAHRCVGCGVQKTVIARSYRYDPTSPFNNDTDGWELNGWDFGKDNNWTHLTYGGPYSNHESRLEFCPKCTRKIRVPFSTPKGQRWLYPDTKYRRDEKEFSGKEGKLDVRDN